MRGLRVAPSAAPLALVCLLLAGSCWAAGAANLTEAGGANASGPAADAAAHPNATAAAQTLPHPLKGVSLRGAAQASAAAAGGRVTRFLSWNVYYANLGARAGAIAQGIARVAPEIASLQETVNERGHILQELRWQTGQQWAMTGTTGCEWYFDGVIYYRSDIWENLASGVVPYGGGGCFSGQKRGLNWAALRRRSDGKGVLAYGTHPVCCRGDWPVMQALQMARGDMMWRQRRYGFPIALMGDLNTGYFEASQQLLREGPAIAFHDAYADANPGNPNPSTIGNAPVRIDYVYFQRSPVSLGREVGGKVWHGLPGGSDHRAVSGDVVIA